MNYEVEQKFRVDDLTPVTAQLLSIGAETSAVVTQVDCYFAHPHRDFSQTDEAFRLRRVGDHNYMTYKGPKIDATTKSRLEEEVRVADGDASWERCREIFRHLGFRPVATVRKRRQQLALSRSNFSIEISLDDVDGLGFFVEVEIGVETARADSDLLDEARKMLDELAGELELSDVERRSYLELLLAEPT